MKKESKNITNNTKENIIAAKNSDKIHFKFKNKGLQKGGIKWPIMIGLTTFFISLFLNITSSILTNALSLSGAIVVLFIIVFIGIGFDILGTAVVSTDLVAFTSMAANKVRGAKEAIFIIKNASVFSNIFNDVIGDTCGIISGATVASIFIKVQISSESIWYVIVGALIAALTVGGKAFGKSFAINHASSLVYRTSMFVSFFNIKNYKVINKKNK